MAFSRRKPGRPQKFGRPSKALTVTLPQDVIARLQGVDPDIGRAIVAVTERRTPRRAKSSSSAPAELASYGDRAVIVVLPVRALGKLPGVQLVPIGGGRALIALDDAQSVSGFELQLRDALEHSAVTGDERDTMEAIASILGQARRSPQVTLKARTIIVLESTRRRRLRK
jgi:hypothetical protein